MRTASFLTLVSVAHPISYVEGMRKLLLASIAALIVLALPGLALAQDNSAIDQYTENVPSADGEGEGGNSEGNGSNSGSDSSSSGSDSSSQAPPTGSSDTLDNAGDEGASGGGEDEDQGVAAGAAIDDEDGGGLSSTGRSDDLSAAPTSTDTDSDSGGIGALPIILGITLLAALGYAVYEWVRRRPSSTASTPGA